MGNLTRVERAAVACVARRFATTWEARGERGTAASMTIDGRRIGLQVLATTRKKGAPRSRPRLRFDRVVLEIVRRLHASLDELVPGDQVLMITITAPIRQAGRTATEIAQRVRGRLRRRAPWRELRATLHGNRIRAARVTGVSQRAPRLIVLVHNPDPEDVPAVLFALMRSLLGFGVPATAAGPAREYARGRWLVLAPGEGLSHAPTLKQILAQLGIEEGFARILLVSPGGRVQTLA